MPVSDVNFTNDRTSTEKLKSALDEISNSDLEISFGDGSKIDRAYLEMIIDEFGKESQNVALANKWIQIDTALEKELRRFKVAVISLLSSVVQTAEASTQEPQQGTVQQAPAAVQPPAGEETSTPAQKVDLGRKLPEPLV
ncbi:MAG: hypothetical protein WC364_12120 [Eubacteriales bacterium]|jgi:hypothetical protein